MPPKKQPVGPPPKPVPGPYLSLAKEQNKVRKMGFLYQRIPEALIWKKRFFVVTETSLLSFGKPIDPASAEFDPEDETSKNLKGYTSLSLTKTELVKATEEMGGSGEDLIKLTTGDATEYFHLCTTKPKGPKPKQKKKVEEEAETTKAADDDVSAADDVVDDMGTKEPSEAVVAAAEDVVLEEANGDVAEVVEPTASPQLEAVSAATEGAGTGDALLEWSARQQDVVEYVWKGTNPFTEMYSGLKAEVLVPGDPTTGMNLGLVDRLLRAERVLVGGEAQLLPCIGGQRLHHRLQGEERNVRQRRTATPCPDPRNEIPFGGGARRWQRTGRCLKQKRHPEHF